LQLTTFTVSSRLLSLLLYFGTTN